MGKTRSAHRVKSDPSNGGSQDKDVFKLFENSLGPSDYFLKRDANVTARVGAIAQSDDATPILASPTSNIASNGAAQEKEIDDNLAHPTAQKGNGLGEPVLSSRKRKRGSGVSLPEEKYLARIAGQQSKSLPPKLSAIEGEPSTKSVNAADASGVPSPPVVDADSSSEGKSEVGEEIISTVDTVNESHIRIEHETLQKSSRTVFLANVSTSAISSKSDRKSLIAHLSSFQLDGKHAESHCVVESLRFRSTPYSDSKLPRKAAFVKKALMDSTAKSTHAYAVYNTPNAAREAVRHLNGTIILGRHLRLDSVAHPAVQDHRRCVFVGNIGFVDDETAIKNAEKDPNSRRPAKSKGAADYEEGLWRTFGQCGKVENVRLVRAQTNQVGKGFAYVQFVDANSVEKALLYNDQKFPPLLPRKLRVLRAKKMPPNAERNRKPETTASVRHSGKDVGSERTEMGRASKLYGRAGAALTKQRTKVHSHGKPSPTVFEGQRATSQPKFTKGKHLTRKKNNGRSERASSFKRQRLLAQS